MKNISMLITTVWNYFVNMNSEPQSGGGGVSIKRNLALYICIVIGVLQLISLFHTKDEKIYQWLCSFYTVSDLLFVLLVLGITSIEKVTTLVETLKNGKSITPPAKEDEEVIK